MGDICNQRLEAREDMLRSIADTASRAVGDSPFEDAILRLASKNQVRHHQQTARGPFGFKNMFLLDRNDLLEPQCDSLFVIEKHITNRGTLPRLVPS
jgi:hypothetical protein